MVVQKEGQGLIGGASASGGLRSKQISSSGGSRKSSQSNARLEIYWLGSSQELGNLHGGYNCFGVIEPKATRLSNPDHDVGHPRGRSQQNGQGDH